VLGTAAVKLDTKVKDLGIRFSDFRKIRSVQRSGVLIEYTRICILHFVLGIS